MLDAIFKQFQTQGTFAHAHPFGAGHINTTFLARTIEKHCPDYILQRINPVVFKHIPALMNNVLLVTRHIQHKLHALTPADLNKACLTLILSHHQQPFVQDDQGHYWTCYLFIEGSRSHDIVTNAKQAYEGGKTLGRFLEQVSDLPSHVLHETLPDFHHAECRLQHFYEAQAEDTCKRKASCKKEMDFVNAHAEAMQFILQLGRDGKISQRITHNDTKFNNILLDEEDNGLCMIDLDTVMPGYIHYDFSDAIRIVANTGAEDEADLDKITFNTNLFTAFCRGFLGEVKPSLSKAEAESLAYSLPLLPYLIGLRFLTDYLQGDVYFKTHFPHHNLQRARAQFQFVSRIQEKLPTLSAIINETLA